MFDGRWRATVDRGTGPVGNRLQRMGITADVLTGTGLVSAAATAVAIGTGHLHVAIVLLIITGLHDLLDGPVAKASGTASVRGAFFDSVTDRVADALLLGGVAWYLASSHPGHLVLLPMAVLAATTLVSYQRAKAESLGIPAKGGLMERAERMILLGVGLLSASFLVPVMWILLALTLATAAGRFARVWAAADGPARPVHPRRPARERSLRWAERRGSRTTRSAARWRARRRGELASRSGRTWRARRAERAVPTRRRTSPRRAG
ncbi:MAG: CDP-alcohol phosphatidyltransferase family protein [Actinomycetota bacterium]|nr:CDP-alcohol phosphatidyltransferase family protein [Actinomycetota bacterium]